MSQRTPFVIRLEREATAATTFVARTQPFKPGMNLVLTDLSVTNEDDDDKYVSFGVQRGGIDYYIETVNIDGSNRYAHCKANVVVPSECRVIARIISPSDGDRYIINIFGYLEERL